MREKPTIYWIAQFTEIESDLYQLSKLTTKFDLRLVSLTKDMEGFGVTKWTNYSDVKRIVLADKTKEDNIFERLELLKRVAKENPDLIITRYGQPFKGSMDKVNEIFKGQNHWLWCSEQGSKRFKQEGIIADGFNNVLANNKVDQQYYQNIFPNKKIKYLPFGCVRAIHKRVKPNPKYMSDCIVDGTPKSDSELTKYKRQSINIMVKPLIGKVNLSAWGSASADYGWNNIEWMKPYYKREYLYEDVAQVYSSCKIYLGITNNWNFGGYGKKLATALACGIFVIWHGTLGIHKDFDDGKHLHWSYASNETFDLVKYHLENDDEREKIALTGQKFAYEHFDFGKNLLKLVKETKL